jgi:hypothetical protein
VGRGRTLAEFQKEFPDEPRCAAFLSARRWPDGFVCPACGRGRAVALRRKHVDAYLNEFVFRYNRRFHRHVSFETVLGLAAHRGPETYRDTVNRDADSPSGASERSTTYRSP